MNRTFCKLIWPVNQNRNLECWRTGSWTSAFIYWLHCTA